jgi:ribosomal protein S27E
VLFRIFSDSAVYRKTYFADNVIRRYYKIKESLMKEHSIKSYIYKCKCGYILNVFIDYGMPQESIKCRKCSTDVRREDN